MANAMLDDTFKSSHPDLIACCDDHHHAHDEEDYHHNDDGSSSFPTSSPRRYQHMQHQQQQPQHGSAASFAHSLLTTKPLYPSALSTSSLLTRGGDSTSAATPTRKKSVDFSLAPPEEPPLKRPRQHHGTRTDPPPRVGGDGDGDDQPSEPPPWTPKQIVDAIATCISPPERWEAIQKAREAFDHGIQSVHDEEMASGADAVLVKHLSFLVYHRHDAVATAAAAAAAANQPQPSDVASPTDTPSPLHGAPPRKTWNRGPNNNGDDSYLREVSYTCSTLECLYRSSSHIVGASFQRMGTFVLPLLVRLIDSELDRRFETVVVDENGDEPYPTPAAAAGAGALLASSSSGGTTTLGNPSDAAAPPDGSEHDPNSRTDEVAALTAAADSPSASAVSSASQLRTELRVNPDALTPEGDLLLHMATKIVCHFARVGTNTRDLCHFPGLLRALLRLLTVKPYDCVPWEARLSALWTVANLACHTDNMQMMVCTPGLVPALVEVACRPLHPRDSLEHIMELLRSRSNASKAILNLSWAPENKVLLAEQAAVVDLLAELTVHRAAPLLKSSRTVRDVLVQTRRHAIAALRNLAAAPRRVKLGLCAHRNGRLLDVLTDAALNDTDDAVRDLAFAAIHNLAVQDTAVQIVQHPALVLALRGALQSEASSGGPDDDIEQDDRDDDTESGGVQGGGAGPGGPRAHAAATLRVLERTITPDMECYEALRDLLDAVNPAVPSDAEQTPGRQRSEGDEGGDGDDDEESSSGTEVINAAEV